MAKLVRTKEAAKIVGLSESQLNKLRIFGGGPEFVKLGARVLYEVDVLSAWIASNRRRSTSDMGGRAA